MKITYAWVLICILVGVLGYCQGYCQTGMSDLPPFGYEKVLGVDLFYIYEKHEGPTFVLLHGFGSQTYTWHKVFDSFAELGSVIAYDRPAFGFTSRTLKLQEGEFNPYTLENQDDLLWGLVNAIAGEDERVILVGHSAGATVGLQTYFTPQSTQGYPPTNRIQALILVDPAIQSGNYNSSNALFSNPNLSFSTPIIKAILMQQLEAGIDMAWYNPALFTAEDRENYKKPLQVEGWEIALQLFTISQKSHTLEAQLGEIDIPVLLITGENDRIISASLTKSFAEKIPHSVFYSIAESGHVPQEEKPEEFFTLVKGFLLQNQLIQEK